MISSLCDIYYHGACRKWSHSLTLILFEMPYPPRFNMAYLITEAILVTLLGFENTYHLRMVHVYCASKADHVLKQSQMIFFLFFFSILQMERVYCITVSVTTIHIYLYPRNGTLVTCMNQFSLLYIS